MKRYGALVAAGMAIAIMAGGTAWNASTGPARDRARMRAEAQREGRVTIWSATDRTRVTDLIAGFERAYPDIAVDYREIPATELDTRFLADRSAGRVSADILWSPAMDLQIKLVNDGYAQTYVSPERGRIAPWAIWKNQAWGTTAEPVVIVYNRRLIEPGAIPRSHLALRRLLEARSPALTGRIGTYDPERSAAGFLYLMEDRQATRDLWRLVRAMGAAKVRTYRTSEDILRDLAAGRIAIGYNVIGSYAADEMTRNRDLGIVLPQDYTLVMSRIAMIPIGARHPAAARLFLDYLLSRPGQETLAKRGMASIRPDVPLPVAMRRSGSTLRAIRVGPALLVSQDRLTRRHFLKLWSRSLATPAD